jgi:hypothetical protein
MLKIEVAEIPIATVMQNWIGRRQEAKKRRAEPVMAYHPLCHTHKKRNARTVMVL